MNLGRNLLWLALSVMPLWGVSQAAQQRYALLSGSTLTDDCPVCDRLSLPLPMTGTFGLRLLDENTLFARYEFFDISFHAGTNEGREYRVSGTGVYQVGGEVAYVQDLFLAIEVDNGATVTAASCTNPDRQVRQPWPTLEIELVQTNGTLFQVYLLTLIAAPIPEILTLVPDLKTGDIRLVWQAGGAKIQVERALQPTGPYLPVGSATTESSCTDQGVLTANAQCFYRLRLL